MSIKTYDSVFELIKSSLWEEKSLVVSEEAFTEMRLHSIFALSANILSRLVMPDKIRRIWKQAAMQQIAYSIAIQHTQNNLHINVPYVILKGTSAAQYYPYPNYRIMGDIDIITRREDFDKAAQQLTEDGYRIVNRSEREICFQKGGITIELHRYFASLNSPKKAKYLDDLIIDNITSNHVLPDMVNGLVLLEHISQHLEHGLGLRQIIDWMMFVNRCLSDEKWPSFKELASNIGLENLAIVATKMCEIYLGLPNRRWCADANDLLCNQFMNYVINCGNFGNKWNSNSDTGQTVLSYLSRPVAAYKWLQERGLVNWKAVGKYPVLKHFAWLYQLGRYILKGLAQEGSIDTLRMEYDEAKKRIVLFNKLGVKQRAKGLVVYRNGKYVKK